MDLPFSNYSRLLSAKCDKEYDDAQKLLFENDITKKYPQFMNHLNKNILPRKEEWAISERIMWPICLTLSLITQFIMYSDALTSAIIEYRN